MTPAPTGDALLNRRFHYIFDTTTPRPRRHCDVVPRPPPMGAPAAGRRTRGGGGPVRRHRPGDRPGLQPRPGATQGGRAKQQLMEWGLERGPDPRARRAGPLCRARTTGMPPRRRWRAGRPTRAAGQLADRPPRPARDRAGAVPSRRPLRLHARSRPGPGTHRDARPGRVAAACAGSRRRPHHRGRRQLGAGGAQAPAVPRRPRGRVERPDGRRAG